MHDNHDGLAELPTWVEEVVVFDTNAYRALAGRGEAQGATESVKKLRKEERSAGILALACPTVLMELIAHLGDSSDPSYRPALAALTAAVTHCTMSDEESENVAIAPSPDLQLCHTLWQAWPEPLQRIDNTIRGLAGTVAANPTEEGLAAIREDLRLAAEAVSQAERVFAEDMRQHLMDNVRRDLGEAAENATAKDLLNAYRQHLDAAQSRLAVAQAHVSRAMSYVDGAEDDAEGIRQRAERVAEWFTVAIELYMRVIRKIAESNWDLTTGKGENCLWDLQVAFLIGPEHRIQGRPVYVVSGDKEIINAAADAGVAELVQPYEDYRIRLTAARKATAG